MSTRTISSVISALGFALITVLLSCTDEKTYITAPIDQRPPSVEWTSINGRTDFQSVVSGSVEIAFQARDESGIDSARLYSDGLLRISLTPDSSQAGRLTYATTYSWNTLTDSDGVHSLVAVAFDRAGNSGSTLAPLTLTVRNTSPDHTPPTIEWLAPLPGTVVRDTVALNFSIRDDSALDSVKVYIDGEVASILAGQDDSLYSMNWNSWGWTNGRRFVEVRAWDSAGNVASSEPIGVTVDNHRVIWVPEDYETIQEAVRACNDGDTVMVRPGTFYESIQFLNKHISLMSSDGPEVTKIDFTGYTVGIWVTEGQDTTCLIRGFTIVNYADNYWSYGIYIEQAGPKIVNNIMSNPNYYDPVRGSQCVRGGMNWMIVSNNLFIEVGVGVESHYSWGRVNSNMFLNLWMGFWSQPYHGQSLIPDYNLLWNCDNLFNEQTQKWGVNNVSEFEPRFEGGSYRLQAGSPGIDQGDPNLNDRDGSRADIGVYGGPHAYNN